MRRLSIPAAFIPGFVLLILLVGGCLESDTHTPNSGTPAARSVLVNYQVTGGIVGYKDQLTIYDDGHADLQRKNVGREFTLDSGQVTALKDLLNKADFPGLKGEYLNINGGADLIKYSITYQVNDKKYTVITEDTAVPDALQPVLTKMNQLISSNS